MLTINRKEFYDILQKANYIVPTKTSLPILNCVKLAFADSKLTVTATDLEQIVVQTMDINSKFNIQIAVNAKKLMEIIKELSENEINISTENNVLKISTFNYSCKLTCFDVLDYPCEPELKNTNSDEILPTILIDMIQKAGIFYSLDESRCALTGVLWEIKNDSSSIVSTSGYCLGKCTYKNNFSNTKNLLMSNKTSNNILRLFVDNDSTITKKIAVKYDKDYILLNSNNLLYYSKLLNYSYPEYENVISENKMYAYINRKELINAVRRVSVMCNIKTKLIKLLLTYNKIKLSAINTEIGGETSQEIDAENNNNDLFIGLNAVKLLEILNIIETDEIKITFKSETGSVLIYPEYEDDKKINDCIYLIMPLRIMENK